MGLTRSKGWGRVRAGAMACVVLAVSATTATSFAQNAQDRAAARDLFNEARKLVKAGNYASACPKLEESQRLDPGVGTLFNLADCYEHTGKTASAWSMFSDAAAASRAAKEPEREKAARQRAQDLEPKLLRLSVMIPPAVEVAGIEVRRDGTVLNKPMWGQAVPVDSGEHKIEVTAPGKKPWSVTIMLSGEGKTETVTIPGLETETAPPPVTPPAPPSSAAPPAPTSTAPAIAPTPAPATSGSSQRMIGLVAGGVGIVSLGLAGYFAYATKSKLSDAEAYCVDTKCTDQKGVDLHDDAVKNADMASIFSGIGALGLVGGAVLYLTAPSGSSTSSAGTRPVLLAGPGSIVVKGAF